MWVNDRAVVTFANYPTVNLNGQFGDDKFNVSPVGLAATVTTINVSGGDSTNGDSLVVNGGLATNDTLGYLPTGPDNGSVTRTGSATVFFVTTESVTIDGLGGAAGGGDTLTISTPAGADQDTLTPGPAFDSGLVTFTTTGQVVNSSLTPLVFSNLGTGPASSLTFASPAREDILIYNGTQASDTFTVTAAAVVTLNSQIPVNIPGVAALRLLGLDGDDTFNVTGSASGLPFTTLLDGGNPSASDVVNLTGNGVTAVALQMGNSDGTAVSRAAAWARSRSPAMKSPTSTPPPRTSTSRRRPGPTC